MRQISYLGDLSTQVLDWQKNLFWSRTIIMLKVYGSFLLFSITCCHKLATIFYWEIRKKKNTRQIKQEQIYLIKAWSGLVYVKYHSHTLHTLSAALLSNKWFLIYHMFISIVYINKNVFSCFLLGFYIILYHIEINEWLIILLWVIPAKVVRWFNLSKKRRCCLLMHPKITLDTHWYHFINNTTIYTNLPLEKKSKNIFLQS